MSHEDALAELARSVGRMESLLETHVKQQAQINRALSRRVLDHEKRIAALESTSSWVTAPFRFVGRMVTRKLA